MKNPTYQRQMFNTISSSYDVVNRILSLGLDLSWRKKLATFLPDKEEITLLDVATGTCDQLLTLMQSGKIQTAFGIDVSDAMLAIGQKKVTKSPYAPQITLQVASALELPFEKEFFDCISIAFGIRNMPLESLQECRRVLKPGGRLLILEFSLPQNKIVRNLHLFYLRNILPKVGACLSKEKKAYRYLNQTIESFPYGSSFSNILQENGFIDVKAYPLSLGVVTLYIGEKD